jgi:4-hydroxy-2-oxoheptanedioate aldolase
MFRKNALKRRLEKGKKCFGVFLELGHPPIAEITAAAGYDCVLIDREHGVGDIASAVPEMVAAQAHGATALLRIPANDPVWIKLALDAGVEGIMIPAILDGAAAKRAAESCRYPPRGIRGFAAPVIRGSSYGHRTEAYLRDIERELLVIGQIETRSGVEACEQIAGTPGIDMIFIGPYDLAANLGYLGQPDHPEALKAIQRVEKAAKRKRKWLGAIPTPGRSAADLFRDGYDLVISHCDVVMLREAAKADVAAMRALARKPGDKRRK